MFLLALLLFYVASAGSSRFYAIPPFLRNQDDGLEKWNYGGMTIVSESYIQLTPNEKGIRGTIWSQEPNILSEWEANFQISV